MGDTSDLCSMGELDAEELLDFEDRRKLVDGL